MRHFVKYFTTVAVVVVEEVKLSSVSSHCIYKSGGVLRLSFLEDSEKLYFN